jgi:hypothetical protein
MAWMRTGTSAGHGPKKALGTQAWTSTAPRAPGWVWASFCAEHAEGEPDVDGLGRRVRRRFGAAVQEFVDADLVGVRQARVEGVESTAVVEVRGVHLVPMTA